VRADDRPTFELLRRLDDPRTRSAALAERAFLHRLGAGCHTPVAGHARLDGEELCLTGLVAGPDAVPVLRAAVSGPASSAEALGWKLADELLARGAQGVLGGSPAA
jgi:hydroxymethylbilane synthase